MEEGRKNVMDSVEMMGRTRLTVGEADSCAVFPVVPGTTPPRGASWSRRDC
jgi:hypothetical protein